MIFLSIELVPDTLLLSQQQPNQWSKIVDHQLAIGIIEILENHGGEIDWKLRC
jgi:hypothetical protein